MGHIDNITIKFKFKILIFGFLAFFMNIRVLCGGEVGLCARCARCSMVLVCRSWKRNNEIATETTDCGCLRLPELTATKEMIQVRVTLK